MPVNDPDLLAIERGTVTAPAGCGKTQLIAEALSRHTGSKPILVLTHTNAGVVALRERLNRAGVPSNAYRLSTIDGWVMRLISTFPARSGHDAKILSLANPRTDYQDIRAAAVGLLESGHISDILAASYARLIVDEHQDSSIHQHSAIAHAARTLPACVLGDPMQAIFGFGLNILPNWTEEVCAYFPVVGELTTPWRWTNAGAEPLGRWLGDVRARLLRGKPIDLREAPDTVVWVELDGTADHRRRLEAARMHPPVDNGCVLIISDSPNPTRQHQFAGQTPGAVSVEAVDLPDLVSFAESLDLAAPDAVECIAQFAQSVMTNVGAANLIRRVRSLVRGTARNSPTQLEEVALDFIRSPSHRAAADLLLEMSKQDGVRTHRPTVLRACVTALQSCAESGGSSFYDAVVRIREQHRLVGRRLPRRAVGSTLLLKGLEAEAAVVLNADSLDRHNLYVAMTRASRAITVCCKSPVLNPRG